MRKLALRSLSLSYQKKDWRVELAGGADGQGPANPSFGMTLTTEYNL